MQPRLQILAKRRILDLDEPVSSPNQKSTGVVIYGSPLRVMVELVDERLGSWQRSCG
jgi:hypothetical protein